MSTLTRYHVRRLIERRSPNMGLIRAEFIDGANETPFVDRRIGAAAHVVLAPQRCPLRWSIFVLQTVHVSHDRLLPLAVFLHKNNPIESVLMFGGEYLRVIDAVEFLHLIVRDGNRLLAVF